MKFSIVCDSAADLTPEEIRDAQLSVVPFYVSFNESESLRDGADIAPLDFYQKMVDNPTVFPKTSTPTIPDYGAAFYPAVKDGMPVLCICITTQFSSSYQAAMGAKQLMENDFPDANIHVMDSQLATGLEGVLVKEAIRLRDMDLTLEESIPLLEDVRKSGHIFFTTKDLKYLRHGGRLGAAAYVAGSLLDIKPILRMAEGELKVLEVCRGQKHAIYHLIDILIAAAKEKTDNLRGYMIGTGVGMPFAGYDAFLERFHEKVAEAGLQPDGWVKMQIGATIGAHTGPYPVGVGFIKKCALPEK